MAKKNVLFVGMLALALVFGMVLAGCSNGDDGGGDPAPVGFPFAQKQLERSGEKIANTGVTAGTFGPLVDGTAPFTYTLVSGEGDTNNTSFVIAGDSLKIGSSPLTSITKVYSVRVQVSDSAVPPKTFARPCTVAVTTPLLTAAIINGGELSTFISTNCMGGTADIPVVLKFSGAITEANLHSVRAAVNSASTYVIWDLSEVTGLSANQIGGTITDDRNPENTGRDKIKGIILPAGLTTIGDVAFENCTALTSIILPAGLTTIGNVAFENCTVLTSIILPAGLTTIGGETFYGCTTLATLILPAGLTTIGNAAFSRCTALTSITLPSSLTNISSSAFYNCAALASITLPAGITSIGSDAFRYCTTLASITLPANLTSIGGNAFNGCTILQTVVFGGTGVAINNNETFPYASSSGTSLKTAYEATNAPRTGTYTRTTTGNDAGSWSRQS
ncbi:MAG: leucine-rich repeat domain-containing protein [Spirochaetaceae bacterium]|nr:leucine-rich repeat domain-containing protein [Spirochaetaceae bacterium]